MEEMRKKERRKQWERQAFFLERVTHPRATNHEGGFLVSRLRFSASLPLLSLRFFFLLFCIFSRLFSVLLSFVSSSSWTATYPDGQHTVLSAAESEEIERYGTRAKRRRVTDGDRDLGKKQRRDTRETPKDPPEKHHETRKRYARDTTKHGRNTEKHRNTHNVMVARKASLCFTSSSSPSRSTSSSSSPRSPALSTATSLSYPSSMDHATADDDDPTASSSPPHPRRLPLTTASSAHPLSVAIPPSEPTHAAPRRPGLQQILSDTSDAPWTLTAFTAFLSHNHCLETLEFTMDASRYRRHYGKMRVDTSDTNHEALPPAKDQDFVRGLWHLLVDAYIRPEGSREVNLPSDVRDPLLDVPAHTGPPPRPELLDPAVSKMYELMEESVLVPFLNSCSLESENPAVLWPTRPAVASVRTHARHSPPPGSSHRHHVRSLAHAHSYSPASTLRPTGSSSGSSPTSLRPRTRQPHRHAHTTSTPAASLTHHHHGSPSSTALLPHAPSDDASTDDTASSTYRHPDGHSPVSDISAGGVFCGPRTPPATPPSADLASPPKRDSGMWKKLGRLSRAAGKKRSDSALRGALE